MTLYIRFCILIVSVLLSINSYAIDHILCNITNAQIPTHTASGNVYTNTYTCTNTYPSSFPSIQLTGAVIGNANGTSVSGSCTTHPLASGGRCQFKLSFSPTTTGSVTFNLRVSIGSLYYLDLPSITTIINPISAVITWPGSATGNASVDSTGAGDGSYLANAVDSSGHPITYIYALSGEGTIVGNQNGTFTLSGVDINNPGTVTITATADDALSVVGTPITIVITNGVPDKVISIYNNSNEAIYPIIETPIQPVDYWMQAQFGVTALNTYVFATTKQYRVYVNPTTGGIPPGGSVTISVPFYSNLVANPSGGTNPDEYVDWWDAIRVYLYDDANSLQTNGYNLDSANPAVTLFSRGLVCLPGSTACTPGVTFPVYAGVQGLPLSDPNQLTEYTFADVVTSQGTPYPIDRTHVDYDISSVDQTYLPVAMEPYGNNQVGYNGTIMDLTTFRAHLDSFVTTYNWPIYVGTPNYPAKRVPGAYNVMINNQPLTNPAATNTIAALTTNWNNCLSNTPASPYHNDCVNVNDLFSKNAANYQTVCGAPAPSATEFLQHIYGWVSFNCPANGNPLASTPNSNYVLAESSYQTLQYSGAFNPYVQLIHSPTYLNTSMYAYSIDDAVGNMNEIGDGIVIAIGGGTGLPNPNKYDKNLVVNINPGTPPNNSPNPIFTAYGICSSTPSSGTLPRGGSFKIQTVTYPCEITLQDSNNVLYHFTLKSAPPYTTPPNTNYIQCVLNDVWCNAVNIDFNTQHDVGTPPPTT